MDDAAAEYLVPLTNSKDEFQGAGEAVEVLRRLLDVIPNLPREQLSVVIVVEELFEVTEKAAQRVA